MSHKLAEFLQAKKALDAARRKASEANAEVDAALADLIQAANALAR